MMRKTKSKGALQPFLTSDGKVVYIKEQLMNRIMKLLLKRDVYSVSIKVERGDNNTLGTVTIKYKTQTGKGVYVLEGQSL